MLITITYDNRKLNLNLSDSSVCDEYECKVTSKNLDEHAILGRLSMAEKELFPINEADLIVVNDAYRPTPTSDILKYLQATARLSKKTKFIVATGCHPSPDDKQLKVIFGDLYNKLRPRILIHDAHDLSRMVLLGNDIVDQPVYISRHFHTAEKVVVIGSVEPHYFAGFTGGRKSIFPGLCDFNTTVRNHRLAVSFKSAPTRLTGNPVEIHLQSLMELATGKQILSIQSVLGKQGRIQSLFCGDINSSFNRACEYSRSVYSTLVDKNYDLVLSEVLPPLDTNLYQLQKSLENSQAAVMDDGTLILFSACREGIGTDYFYHLADRWKVEKGLSDQKGSDFGIHKLARVAQIVQRINVWLYSDLDEGISDKVFFKTTKDPQKVINDIIEKNKGIRVAVVRDAGHTVLRVH
jgi:nickel-dependent lactate racemase